MWLFNLKIHFYPMRKNSFDKILKGKSKEQHLSIVSKSYFLY